MINREVEMNLVGCSAVGPKKDGLKPPKELSGFREKISAEALRISERVREHLLDPQNSLSAKEDAIAFVKGFTERFTITYKLLFVGKNHDGPTYPKRRKTSEWDRDRKERDDFYTLENLIGLMRYLDVVTEIRHLTEDISDSFCDEELQEIGDKAFSLLKDELDYRIGYRLEDEDGNPIEEKRNGHRRKVRNADSDCYEVPELNDFEKAVRRQIENIVRRKGKLAIW